MDAPILRYLLPIGPDSPTVGRWTRTHDYDVWTDCRAADAPPLTLWEARENGVLRIPDDETVMHVVKGGTPHHVAQLFGYWRACDSDLVWFRIARADFVRYAIVLGGTPEAYVNDAILWNLPVLRHVARPARLRDRPARDREILARRGGVGHGLQFGPRAPYLPKLRPRASAGLSLPPRRARRSGASRSVVAA